MGGLPTWVRTTWNGTVVPGLGFVAGAALAGHLVPKGWDPADVAAGATAATSAASSPLDLLLARWEERSGEKRVERLAARIEALENESSERGERAVEADGDQGAPAWAGDPDARDVEIGLSPVFTHKVIQTVPLSSSRSALCPCPCFDRSPSIHYSPIARIRVVNRRKAC
jgi:hypothetical protein